MKKMFLKRLLVLCIAGAVVFSTSACNRNYDKDERIEDEDDDDDDSEKLSKKDKADILTALNWQKKSEQWLKDNGQFIPYPATYLNQRRWEDEPQEVFCGDITDPDRYKEDEEDNFDFNIGFMHKK